MLLKIGANIDLLHPKLRSRFDDIDSVFKKYSNVEGVITSGNDSRHSVGSLHYKWKAIDLRVWYVSKDKLNLLVEELQEKLGHEFDVVLEIDHIHIEYDPK